MVGLPQGLGRTQHELEAFALASLAMAAMTFVLYGQEPNQGTKNRTIGPADQGRSDLREQILPGNSPIRTGLLKLKQRLDKSPKPEDRARGVVLASPGDDHKYGISVQFEQLVDFLKNRTSRACPTSATPRPQHQAGRGPARHPALLREDTRAGKLRDERLLWSSLSRNRADHS